MHDLCCLKCGSMHHSTQNHNEATEEMNELETRVTRLLVCKEGANIFDAGSYEVELCDEGGGEFISVRELNDSEGEIRIDKSEWEDLRSAIEWMMGGVR